MTNRILIGDLREHVGQEVEISAYVDVRRDHGKLIFFDLHDRSGKIQAVAIPQNEGVIEVAGELKPQWVVKMRGTVNQRPEKMIKTDEPNGTIEFEIKAIEIIGRAKELPFELGTDINIDTYLDFLPLTLRTDKARKIFAIQTTILKSFREFLNSKGFTEIQAPKLIGDDAEGGANSFNVEYFGHTAHLAQSPQLYKQIMVGVFERVFAAGNVYRAEKHSTTRHLNEYTSLDLEMGFIEDFKDVAKTENELLIYVMQQLRDKHADDFKALGADIPEVPVAIPFIKLREAQKLISEATGEDCTNEPDLEPQHERWLCEYSKKEFCSDFIFVTHFPLSKRPFYTYEDKTDPGYAAGFDLLFRGLEITTGGQRIHDYDELVKSLEGRGLKPEQFSYYLQAFKYGMPPHGGLGLGLERITAKLLGIDNIKEATLFPRDLNRIDVLLSK